MSQDNPEAGDVFATPKIMDDGYLVYFLVRNNDEDTLRACWFTAGVYPTLRPVGIYPRPEDRFLCNINKLFRSIEEKLSNAATDA